MMDSKGLDQTSKTEAIPQEEFPLQLNLIRLKEIKASKDPIMDMIIVSKPLLRMLLSELVVRVD